VRAEKAAVEDLKNRESVLTEAQLVDGVTTAERVLAEEAKLGAEGPDFDSAIKELDEGLRALSSARIADPSISDAVRARWRAALVKQGGSADRRLARWMDSRGSHSYSRAVRETRRITANGLWGDGSNRDSANLDRSYAAVARSPAVRPVRPSLASRARCPRDARRHMRLAASTIKPVVSNRVRGNEYPARMCARSATPLKSAAKASNALGLNRTATRVARSTGV